MVVLAGGYDGFSLLDHVEVYSPDGRCQRALAPLPSPTYGAVLAYAGGLLLACGGQSPGGMVGVACYAFDREAGRAGAWRRMEGAGAGTGVAVHADSGGDDSG